MSTNEMNAQVKTYFNLLAQIKELEAEAEAIKDAVKMQMYQQDTEVITGDGWSATWHNTTTNRFDSKAFKAEYNDLYKQFCKPSVGTRFTLQPVKT